MQVPYVGSLLFVVLPAFQLFFVVYIKASLRVHLNLRVPYLAPYWGSSLGFLISIPYWGLNLSSLSKFLIKVSYLVPYPCSLIRLLITVGTTPLEIQNLSF